MEQKVSIKLDNTIYYPALNSNQGVIRGNIYIVEAEYLCCTRTWQLSSLKKMMLPNAEARGNGNIGLLKNKGAIQNNAMGKN